MTPHLRSPHTDPRLDSFPPLRPARTPAGHSCIAGSEGSRSPGQVSREARPAAR